MKKLLKVVLWLVGGLVALVVLFHAEEYVRGRYLWERHLRELAAQGDSLDIRKLVPPPIPDDQNMAAAPIFAELFATNRPDKTQLGQVKLPEMTKPTGGDWRRGKKADTSLWRVAFSNDHLLAALMRYGPVLQEVEVSAQRPRARFPIRYEDGIHALCPHLPVMLRLLKLYRIKVLAELEAGQTDAAFHDIRVMLRLTRALEDEPTLISILVRISAIQCTLQPVWEGLAAHTWNEQQLSEFQSAFPKMDLFPQIRLAMQHERCNLTLLHKPGSSFLDELNRLGNSSDERGGLAKHLIPVGWIYFNVHHADCFYIDQFLPIIDQERQRFHSDRARNCEQRLTELPHTPYNILTKIICPSFLDTIPKMAISQVAQRQATIACTLEIYRLARGRYPDKLDELVPQYLAAVPSDVMDGQPLRYRLEGANGFVLYSIGWNMKDDSGQVAWIKPSSEGDKPKLNDKAGDWVWRSQPTAP